MYAADTCFTYASGYTKVINNSVNEELCYRKSLLQANKLSRNVAKMQCPVISSRNRLKNVSDNRVASPLWL